MYQYPYTLEFDNGEVVVYQHITDAAHAVMDYFGDVVVKDAYGYPIPEEDVLCIIGY